MALAENLSQHGQPLFTAVFFVTRQENHMFATSRSLFGFKGKVVGTKTGRNTDDGG